MDTTIQIIFLSFACVLLANACNKDKTRERDPLQEFIEDLLRDCIPGDRHDPDCNRGRVYKRSTKSHENRYNVTIPADPCLFFTYDLNKDGEFAKAELITIFGNDIEANALFADLDTESGDGVITEEEFNTMAPLIIANCLNKNI